MLRTNAPAIIAMLAAIVFTQSSYADSPRENNAVVRDKDGGIVHAISNNTCVRTKWIEGNDVCAPKPTLRTSTQTVLMADERVVYFDFDKSDLTPAAEAKLRSVARRLLQSEDVASAQVVGFADRIGDTEYNTSLSARRAQTVRDFLVKNGYLNVNVTNLRAMGESSPVTNCSRDVDRNSQITCLRPDRRVEIELMYIGQVVTTTVEPDAELSR